MVFLNPFLLFGSAAAAIPIIIHLLNLRKLKTVDFSTLQFLKELQKTKMRRVKIRQWILLLLRTLVIIMLVLAFSRPALRGSFAGAIGSHAKTTIVILLDDSPSMNIRNDRGMIFNQAKEAALQLLSLLNEGDEAYLVKLSDVRHKEAFSPIHSAEAFRSELGLPPSQETVEYRSALGIAAKILSESKHFNHEVYLITDGQATQFASHDSQQDTTDLFGEQVNLFLVDAGQERQDNASIMSVEVITQIVTLGKPVQIHAVVHNFGEQELRNSVMSVYLDGTRVMQQSLDIAQQSSTPVTLSVIPKRSGILYGYVQLEDDALDIDNRRFFVLHVPKNIDVIVSGPTPQETHFVSLALRAEEDTATSDVFTVQYLTRSQLSSTDINKYDVVILCGFKDFAASEAHRVAEFVTSGGGVMIFPGKDANITNYNETLFARLRIPAAQGAKADTPRALPENERSFLTFGQVDFAHPLFSGLFEQSHYGTRTPPTIESPKIFTAISPPPGSEGQTIISLSNGVGFLTEYPAESGRVLLFSVEAGLTWSDFPVKGLFVPLLYRSVVYLAARSEIAPSFVIGEQLKVMVRLRSHGDRESYMLRSPSALDEKIAARFLSSTGSVIFESSNVSEVGIYELRRTDADPSTPKTDRNTIQAVAVNVAPSESDLRRVNDMELRAFWSSIGVEPEKIRRVPATEKIDTAVIESRFGVELWKYCVALALLFAVVEMIIGREPKSTESSVGE